MIKCMNWPVSVCTWSLKNDVSEIARIRELTGIGCLHAGLKPLMEKSSEAYLQMIQDGRWQMTSTMVGFPQEDYSTLDRIRRTGGIIPQEYWEVNKDLVIQAITLTRQLNVKYLSFHFGFLDFSDVSYMRQFMDKVKMLADKAGENKVCLLMETGQETADELRRFLVEMDHPALGVNYDPANLILYRKGDPIAAVDLLLPWIRHIHIKDGIETNRLDLLGKEVPWGEGNVDSRRFLSKLKESDYSGALAIEREAGENRIQDICKAVENLTSFSSQYADVN